MLRKSQGQSLVIGFMLLLALSIALLGWFQITQLPEINRDSEIEYQGEVESDMNDLRRGIWEVTQDPNTEVLPVSITTTVDYPLQTSKTDASTAQLGFRTLSTDAYDFNNTDPSIVLNNNVTATKIEHRPTFFVRDPSTTSIENNVVTRETGSGFNQTVGSQLLVSENQIYLSQLNVQSASIVEQNPEFILRETGRESVTITAQNDSNPITLEATTTLSEQFWRDQFADVDAVDETEVQVVSGILEVPLDPSQSYEVLVSRMTLDED